MKHQVKLRHMVYAALFLALAYVLPFLTGQIPQIGAMLCPMHVPVLLCGFFCGWQWGLLVGCAAPLFRALTLGMPPLFPTAVCMAVELAAYGAFAGMLYQILPKKKINVYVSLLAAMIAGRILWGTAMTICLSASGSIFGFSAFIAGAVTNAIPGIIIQIILIPAIVIAANHLGIWKSTTKPNENKEHP